MTLYVTLDFGEKRFKVKTGVTLGDNWRDSAETDFS